MKTNKQNKTATNQQDTNNSGLNRSEQSRTENQNSNMGREGQRKGIRTRVNTETRDKNRQLPTVQVLDMMRNEVPEVFSIAEIVGKWVWVCFNEIPSEQTRVQLAQIGFHWNNIRKCWQHPCGQFSERGTQDPRQKYGSHPASNYQRA